MQLEETKILQKLSLLQERESVPHIFSEVERVEDKYLLHTNCKPRGLIVSISIWCLYCFQTVPRTLHYFLGHVLSSDVMVTVKIFSMRGLRIITSVGFILGHCIRTHTLFLSALSKDAATVFVLYLAHHISFPSNATKLFFVDLRLYGVSILGRTRFCYSIIFFPTICFLYNIQHGFVETVH